jgi:hypothetical protein
MLPRIRAITSPTRSEKEVNERAPIAIHTQNDIQHHLQRQAASSFPPSLLPNKGGKPVDLHWSSPARITTT